MNSTIKVVGNGGGVYLLKCEGVIVYVGMSARVLGRLSAHNGKTFDEVEVLWLQERKNRQQLERKLIAEHQPKYNLFPDLRSQQIRLVRENRRDIAALVRDAHNDLLTQSKAANYCIRKGLPVIRKLFVKPK